MNRCLISIAVLTSAALPTMAWAQPENWPSGDYPKTPYFELLSFPAQHDGKPLPIREPEQWNNRRVGITGAFQQVAGNLPPEMHRGHAKASEPQPCDLQITETTEQDGVPRQTISIASRNGERVTAYLWVPKDIPAGERRAAIVALHPTGPQGKGIVAGYGAKQYRNYGIELAQRGYVVIAPDYVGFGDQASHDLEKDDYVSGTMKGIVDHMRCIDYLCSRADVDPKRIGVIGHSLGGHNTIFLGLFDPRPAAFVSSCGWTNFHHYYGGKKLANWAQPRYMPNVVAKFNADPDKMPFDFDELVAALAPRPFLSISPLADGNFEYQGVKKAAVTARGVYELFGDPEKLQIRYPDCGHDFPDLQRREAYAFLDAALAHKRTAVVPDYAFAKPERVQIKSTLDGSEQPCDVFAALEMSLTDSTKYPLLVSLHSWSGTLVQRHQELLDGAARRNWIVIMPNFRGANETPEACGSKLAQQDILDAVEWACTRYNIDRQRIYLTGSSGGGHMTLQMAANHPQVWAAASAWVGISDLPAWHTKHMGRKYSQMMEKACGGAPGMSAAVDAEYAFRSPRTNLKNATAVPLEISAGIFDGHFGHSVPVSHSLWAFNEVAKANGDELIDDSTIAAWVAAPWRTPPTVDEEQLDKAYDRTVYFRRTSKNCTVTLFEGHHERMDDAALKFLERHVKP